ncbi:MAG: S-adenosylmethionine decarboxylase [Isosphaeraceae bacterium]
MKIQVARTVYKLYDCDPQRLGSPASVWRLLREVTRESWKTRLGDSVSGLPGGGISGFVRLREMHISIHTWPLKRYAEISFSLSNSQSLPENIDFFFTNRLGAAWIQTLNPSRSSPFAEDALVQRAQLIIAVDSRDYE